MNDENGRSSQVMSLNELSIDTQLYQDEIRVPSEKSMILLPRQNVAVQKNQLLLKWSNTQIDLSQRAVDQAAHVFFSEWAKAFPLYTIDRAFLDQQDQSTIEVLITFDSSSLFSNTQIRNIKMNAPLMLKSALQTVAGATSASRVWSPNSLSTTPSFGIQDTQVDVNRDLQFKINELHEKNNQLQYDLQKNKSEELRLKEMTNELLNRLEHQQRDLQQMQDMVPSDRYQQVISSNEDLTNQLHQSQQELMVCQSEVHDLTNQLSDNNQAMERLKQELNQAKQDYDRNFKQLLQENDLLQENLMKHQETEIDLQQQLQVNQTEILTLKNEMAELKIETGHEVEGIRQQNQHLQQENDDLRLVMSENQKFEEQVQTDLNDALTEIAQKETRIQQLEQENALLVQEWSIKYEQLSHEKQQLEMQLDSLNQLLVKTQNEVSRLEQQVTQQEQLVQQTTLSKQRMEQELRQEISHKENQIAQAARDQKEEVNVLVNRLDKQQELVNTLMDNQKTTQLKWQENYNRLESNYQTATETIRQLEHDLLLAKQGAKSSVRPSYEPSVVEVPIVTEPVVEPETVTEVVETVVEEVKPAALPTYSDDELDHDYEEVVLVDDEAYEYSDDDLDDDDYDHEDDYYSDDDYGYDYGDYDYSDYANYDESDDIMGYDAENLKGDVDELFDHLDEDDEIVKIKKKEYLVYEDQLTVLEERWHDLGDADPKFRAWIEPKMKGFKRFYKYLDEDVTPPKFLSRSYKMDESVWNKVQAYALISRHIKTILELEE